MHAKSLQSCLTLCNTMDCSPPGSSVHGIFQARIVKWVAMPSSRGSSQPRDRTHVSCISCIGRQVLCYWSPLGGPVIHLYISVLFQILFPHRHYRAWGRVHCAAQEALVGFLLTLVWMLTLASWCSPPTPPHAFVNHTFAFHVCEFASVL